MTTTPALLLLLSLSCSDKAQEETGGPPAADSAPGGPDTDTEGVMDSGPTSDTAMSIGEELPCDQEDNDLDGTIDEGSGDIDGDGVVDCSDMECQLTGAAPLDVETLHTCASDIEAAEDPWNLVEAWDAIYDLGRGRVRSIFDVDGDGISDLLISGSFSEGISSRSGVDGSQIWYTDNLHEDSSITVGDVDADDAVELLGTNVDGQVCALNLAGDIEWCSLPDVGSDEWGGSFASLRIADLDGDGRIEVINKTAILDGSSGEVLKDLEVDKYNSDVNELAIVDLDGDGQQEIVGNWRIYSSTGETLHALEGRAVFGEPVIPIPIQLDADPDAEIIWIGMNEFRATEPDGTEIDRVTFTSTEDWVLPMASCAGDITGDGGMEFFTTDRYHLYAWDDDLELLWAFPVEEQTGGAIGCSVFDFDLDGREEILVSDYANVYILSGDGELLFIDTDWDSYTSWEIPMVADLDGDGSVEVIFSGYPYDYETYPSVRVYSHAAGGWPPGTGFWPDDTWSGTSVWPDGSVPRQPATPWLEHGVWRGQPESLVTGRDLVPEVIESCVSSCWEDVGTVSLAVRMENRGPQQAPAGTPLAVYGLDEAGGLALIEVLTLTQPLDAGWASATGAITVDRDQAARGLRFVAGDDGSGALPDDDCDPGNNVVDWASDLCQPG